MNVPDVVEVAVNVTKDAQWPLVHGHDEGLFCEYVFDHLERRRRSRIREKERERKRKKIRNRGRERERGREEREE